MKTLYLVRHAKSEWEHGHIPDIDRPLNARGYRDADVMSSLLKEKKIIPDLIVTSPAVRAITTALIFCRNFHMNPADILIVPDLYESTVKQYTQRVSGIDNRYKQVMLFGHNQVISNFANSLTTSFTEAMPTCAIAGIRFPDCKEWAGFSVSSAELLLYDFPKKHM